MTHLEQVAATARRGNSEMMARHNQAIEYLKLVIDQQVRRMNGLVEAGVSDAALANESVRALAAVVQARAELP